MIFLRSEERTVDFDLFVHAHTSIRNSPQRCPSQLIKGLNETLATTMPFNRRSASPHHLVVTQSCMNVTIVPSCEYKHCDTTVRRVIHVSIVGEKNGAVFDCSQQTLSPKPEERKCWHLGAHRGREFQQSTKPWISTNPTDRPLRYRNTGGPFYVSNYNTCTFAWVMCTWRSAVIKTLMSNHLNKERSLNTPTASQREVHGIPAVSFLQLEFKADLFIPEATPISQVQPVPKREQVSFLVSQFVYSQFLSSHPFLVSQSLPPET